jgi:hypothetical protein
MKKILSVVIGVLFAIGSLAQKSPSVYVDKNGTMRWSGTNQEASFFGVNYTMPFAHAYRAAGYLGIDRKKAIDEDVYHFARLGFNAFRIHIWDVEITDARGNLVENDHLDLLDYLISKLRERNIYTVITAQTNFGNGYPERNQATGGFSYNYDKCNVHVSPEAVAAQWNYLAALARHVNPYTGKAYKDEPGIVGFEINNEPCHPGSPAETRAYINSMLDVLQQAGNRKPVFYNVSHNLQQEEAYFSTNIQGTTYQWYPTGLVAGHMRKGNFLLSVDQYPIPFSKIRGFSQKARLVYEFDPADLLYSYMYPAMVRSFRSAGFQWITQFAYDPMELARVNTEYQTHYLNLAYTPGKAISMKIAAEAAFSLPRNKSFGVYPADTVFGNFRVSYKQDLSELNSPDKFYYSNSTQTVPVDALRLKSVAGVGSSPVVGYEGTGAYFIDKLEDGIWRLEVMPDVVRASDPFAKPSLNKDVGRIYRRAWDMALSLPDLGKSFSITGINLGNPTRGRTGNGIIRSLMPGVYLLQKEGIVPGKTWQGETVWGTIRLNEFVAPRVSDKNLTVYHEPAKIISAGEALKIKAIIAGFQFPDSVLVYPDNVSFWSPQNPYYKMKRTGGYNYQVVIPADNIKEISFKYNIVVFSSDQKQTFPANESGSPLDWDYTGDQFYTTQVLDKQKPIVLFSVTDKYSGLESFTLPEWSSVGRMLVENAPTEKNTLRIVFQSDDDHPRFYLRTYIGDEVACLHDRLKLAKYLCLQVKKAPEGLKAGFVTSSGYTYRASCPQPENNIVRIPLSALQQAETALLPVAYPVFTESHFYPVTAELFRAETIESFELSVDGEKGQSCEIELGSVWIE